MPGPRRTLRAGRVLVLLLVPVLEAGCGGSSSPSAPSGPSTPGPSAGTFRRGPYLQHSDNGVSVVWYTDAAEAGRVVWSVADLAGESPPAPGQPTRHEAVIGSLAPGARYSYRVQTSRGPLTAPGGATDFSFRAPDPEVLRFVVMGDTGLGTPEQAAIAKAIAQEAALPDLVVIVGDVIYPPADDASYDPRFFEPYRTLLPQVPFYAAPGNHDYEVQSGRPFFDVFTLPRNGPAALPPESSYWVERAGAQLVFHDTNQTPATLRTHSLPWHAELARHPATFRFTFQHHTMYSSGPNHSQYPSTSLRGLLGPLYTAAKVDVAFNGHDHLYERTRPIGGVVYVTTGAGGAELYQRVATQSFTAAFYNEKHSYTYVEVRGRTMLLRQTDVNGKGIDALAITKPVAAADALYAFAGTGQPPGGWTDPGFDDASWPVAGAAGHARAVRARRAFDVEHAGEVQDAIVRVGGVQDYVVFLNGAEVARGGGPDDPDGGALAVPVALLRPGRNALALEGHAAPGEAAPPSVELSLVSSPRR